MNQYDSTVRQLMPRETSANPYSDAVQRLAGAQRAQVTGAELEVDGIAPDQFARGRQLADETGMPPMVAARELPTIEAERERERFRQLTGGSPTLSRWLAKPENMGVAKDDVEQLSALEAVFQGARNLYFPDESERVARSVGQGAIEDFAGRALTGAGELLEIAQRRSSPTGQTLNEQLQDIVALVNPEVRALQTADPTLYAQYRDKVRDWSSAESWLRSGGGGLAEVGQAIGVPQDQQGLPEAIGRGVGQVAGQLAAAPLGVAAQTTALVSQGASIQAERVQEAGAEGTAGGDAAIVAGAAVTGITERLGLDFLMRKLPPGVQGALSKRLADTLLSGAGEATQEVIEGLGQDLVEYQFYNPDVDIAEGWQEDATVGGAVGIIVRALTHARARAVETRDSIEDAKRIETITEAAAASKVGKRYPQALADFIRQARADGQPIPDAVYLDAAAVGRYFFQQGQDPAAEMARLAGSPEAATEAGITGDLRVSMERWAAYVAQRPDAAELNRHARLDPERMTAAEAEALDIDDLLAQIYGGTEAAAARAEASAQEQDAAERVRADLVGQLTAAGVDRSAAELQAQVLANRYQTRAERRGLGESAWDVYAMSGLTIDRETPAVRRLRSQVEQFDTTIDPLIDAVRTGKMPDDRAVFGTSLVSALVRAGGLRDTGGDLRSRGALRLRPGLVSQNGMGLDDALVWARERGYVSADENAVDEQAFFDLIDAELSGGQPTYSDQLISQRMAGFRAAVEDLAQELDRLGVDPATATNEQVKQALGLQAGGGRAFDQAPAVFDLTPGPRNRRTVIDGVSLSYAISDGVVKLNLIRTPPEQRGQGAARRALSAFLAETDAAGLPVELLVAEQDATTDADRLRGFYESAGFRTVEGDTMRREVVPADSPSVEAFRGVTREQFLGSPRITPNANAADLRPRALDTVSAADAVPFAAGEGLTARYSEDGAAVYDGDRVIASYNFGDTLVVDKAFRRAGIGAELVYQWRIRNPGARPAASRTRASQALQERVWDRIQSELRAAAAGRTFQQSPADYGGDHRPMTVAQGAATLDSLTDAFGEDIYGPNALQYFGSGDRREAAVLRILRSLRGKPDATVTIYRGAPAGAAGINPGDWVTLSREAAQDYADETEGGRVLSMQVPASHVTAWPDALLEQGYYPPGADRTFQQAEDQTQTPEFKRWFGDSKVVDAEGRPLVVYHGTRGDFDTFDAGRQGQSDFGASGRGFYFSQDPGSANLYANLSPGEGAPNIMPVYVALQNPYEMGALLPQDEAQSTLLTERLKAEGYDGIIVRGADGVLDEIVAFRPEQIKSATGNRGAFDPNDPRIQYQRPEPTKVERGRIEFRTDGGARIVLTESANLSTFLHETGHLWLEELITDATTVGTSPELAADLDRVLAWMGVDVRAADGAAAVRAAVQTDQHEQWARGFEAYLREGKAPSSALRQAFSRFRAWLLRLYRDVRALRVELSDEVRGVMDRLIATDAEIDEAQAANGYEAFADPEQARALGMTDAEWQEYARLMEAATREAREDIEQSLMRAWSREQQDYYRQERARMRERVEAEVNERPVYRAMLTLFSPEGMKLDKADLVERYGDAFLSRLPGPGADRRNRGPYVYTLQGGTGLDQAAFLLGFDSGDALVQALVNAENRRDVIEAETDARMRDFYPDPMTDGTIAEKAQRAVHNGNRVEVIERELQVIARAAGQRAQQARVIRALAERIIGRQKIRALRPRDYLVAERKAAREAVEAIAKRQFDIAYRAKYRQALNARLYALASEASDNVEGARKYLRKFETKEKRQKLGKAGGTWLDQVDALIDAHDLKTVSNLELDRVAALRELDAAAASGLITVPPELRARLEDSRRVNWRELTVDELLALRDTVRNIDSVAMRELEMIIDGQVRDLDADADAIAASIMQANAEVPANLGSQSRRELLAKWGREALAIWHRPSDAVRNVEGNGRGPLMQRTIEVIRRAVGSKLEPMKAKAREDLAALYQKHYSDAELVKMAKFRTRVPGVNQDWTRFDLLALALNWGNADNRAAVLDSTANGRKMFSEAGVNQALQTLDARDWAFVQDVWDYVDSFWPEVSAAQKRRTGIAPKKVEASPITVQTRDGQTVEVRGGYYPLSYDPGSSPAVAQSELEDIFNRVKAGGFSRAATSRGHTIERVGSGGRPVRMDINVLHSHVDQVIHDLALGDAVEYVWKVLNHGTVKAAFGSVGKLESHKWLNLWLKDAAAGEMGARSLYDSAFRWIRIGFTKSRLGFNLVSAALQPTGFLQSAVVVGKANMIRGITAFASSPREAYKQVMERSDFMRTRYELSAWNKDVQDTMTALRGKHGLLPSWIGPAMFYMMQKTQVVVDVSTWLGAYHRGLQDHNGDDAAAAAYADGIVEQAQTSGFFSDRSAIERGTLSETTRQSEFVRSWTTLISYMLAKGNIAYTRVRQTDYRSIPQVANLAGDLAMLFTFEALLVALIRGAWPGEDDSWLWWLGSESVYSVLGGIPFVRELSSAAKGFSVTGTPQAGLLNDTGKVMTQLQQGEVDAALLKSLNNVGGTLFHYPSAQMNRAIDAYWRENVEGEDVAPIEYITGRRGPPE